MKYWNFRTAIFLMVLAASCRPSAAQLTYTYTTISVPTKFSAEYEGLTQISGNLAVGNAGNDNGEAETFIYNLAAPSGSNVTVLDDPSAPLGAGGTYGFGIEGTDVYGSYSNGSSYVEFNYNTATGVYTNGTAISDPLGVSGSTAIVDMSGSNVLGSYTSSSTGSLTYFVYNGSTYTDVINPGNNGGRPFSIDGTNIVGETFFFNPTTGVESNVGYEESISGGDILTLSEPNLNQSGAHATIATGISGQNIVGIYTTSTGLDGFLYNGSSYVTIQDPNAAANSETTQPGTYVNGVSGSTVVGYYQNANGSQSAFVATLAAPAVTVTSTSTPVSAGASYSTVAPLTATGGLQSTISLVGGSASTTGPVTLASTNVGGSYKSGTASGIGLASDVFTISGNAGNVFAVELTFNLTAANALGGSNAMTLLWLDPTTGSWVNAVDGNMGGTPTNMGDGAYNPATDFALGDYGYDDENGQDYVWAVINHNSTFGVGNPLDAPVQTPEPSTWALLLGGCGLLAFFRQARHKRVVAGAVPIC
jgi:hypothetical protein